jgi:hypothetical protein
MFENIIVFFTVTATPIYGDEVSGLLQYPQGFATWMADVKVLGEKKHDSGRSGYVVAVKAWQMDSAAESSRELSLGIPSLSFVAGYADTVNSRIVRFSWLLGRQHCATLLGAL